MIAYTISLSMSRLIKLFQKTVNNPADVRFSDLCRLAEAFGLLHQGGKGSHEVYSIHGVAEMLTFQNVGGRAKPYQVRQFLKFIEDNGLEIREEK